MAIFFGINFPADTPWRALSSQAGNIALVMAIAVFGLATGISMTTFLYYDTLNVRQATDGLQELHLLRSETSRGEAVIGKMPGLWDDLYLPKRKVTVQSSNTTNTYLLQTKLSRASGSAPGDDYYKNGFLVSSLVKVKRGILPAGIWGENLSPVSRYAEKFVFPLRFSSYMYFTDRDQTPNSTPNYFWGPDVLYGRVHSNSDIWIKQGGGGTNNGWPTFFGKVSTAGSIHSVSGAPPYAAVFQGGYYEHTAELEFHPTADLIRAHGMAVGSTNPDPSRIMFVSVDGSAYTSMVGQVVSAGIDTADVWSSYPPRSGSYLYRNRFTQFDTIWTAGPTGIGAGHSNLVYSKLWLKGAFQGAQTWCSTDTLYLNDDCTLYHTPIGLSPDGSGEFSAQNQSDYLGIVSEKSILIQYGYRNPQSGERSHPNCEGGNDGIWIYAALCALGNGQGDSHRDGVFSFEYQHPHSSTPAVHPAGSERVWDKIDLHRHQFPQTATQPWLPGLDYPWYNPLWPESAPLMERGRVHVYGAIAQRRAGYLHRNRTDSDYPNPGGIWNIPSDFCGGEAGTAVYDQVLNLTLQPINAPGTSGNGIGYAKDYHYDTRFNSAAPPDYPAVFTADGKIMTSSKGIIFKRPPSVF